MDDVFFSHARLIDPERCSETLGDVWVRKGRIVGVGPTASPPEGCGVVNCEGLCLAPGIVDLGVKVCEPGERHKESFRTAAAAAAAGGITTMITRPDTIPAIDSPETLEFALRRARAVSPVHVLPMAALTKGRAGQNMTEIGLLMDAGAAAFSDGDRPVPNARVLLRTMAYARGLGALIVGHPQQPDLSAGAAATSGRFASLQGLPTVSPMAERMGLERDLALAEMTGVKYHADQITTAVALPALERAQANGVDISAGVSIHHLTLNETDIAGYRSFFKLKPPLRSEQDRRALVAAVKSGGIQVICSMHTPQDEESKRLPFETAAAGAVGLETLLPAALRLYHGDHLGLPELFRALALNPARRLGLEGGRLAAGAPADLVLFDPDAPFVLDRFRLRSKSRNTPFDGTHMQGKVIATYVGGQRVYQAP